MFKINSNKTKLNLLNINHKINLQKMIKPKIFLKMVSVILIITDNNISNTE